MYEFIVMGVESFVILAAFFLDYLPRIVIWARARRATRGPRGVPVSRGSPSRPRIEEPEVVCL